MKARISHSPSSDVLAVLWLAVFALVAWMPKTVESFFPVQKILKVQNTNSVASATISVKPSPPISYDPLIQLAAERNGLDPLLLKAIITVESGFDQRCVSDKGAHGLMQLMPGTARLFGVTDIDDPAQNIAAGARHFRYLYDRFSPDLRLSLAAYNAGELPVCRYRGIPPYEETQKYVERVLRYYHQYKA